MADLTGDGHTELLATRGNGYLLPWSFDVLALRGERWRTLAHVPGVLPTEVLSRDLSTEDFAGQRYTIVVSHRRLLVETLSGRRRWLALSAAAKHR
jgi:hypothetical protein